jgi:nucleoside 2-deoxyribosyltransferase
MTLLRIGELSPVRELANGVPLPAAGADRRIDVYIAAPLATAREAYAVGLALKRASPNMELVSRWLHRCLEKPACDPDAPLEREVILWNNIIDIERADIVIALTGNGTPKATFGDIVWALAKEKPVVWIANWSQGRNIWDAHWAVTRINTPDPLRSLPAIVSAIKMAIIRAHPQEPSARGGAAGSSAGEADLVRGLVGVSP